MIRSLAFIPSHKIDGFNLIARKKPDAVCFDLEDSLPFEKKKYGLKKLKKFLSSYKKSKIKLFVRMEKINNSNKDFFNAINNNIHSILIPKVSNTILIKKFESELSQFEKKNKYKNKIYLSFLVESINGFYNLDSLIKKSKRVKYLIYGEEDFLADFEFYNYDYEPNLDFYKSKICFLAKEFNLQAIYTPYLKIKNLSGLKKHIKISKNFGFNGMLVVHPKQIDITNKEFMPTKKDYEISKKILLSQKSKKYEGQNISILRGNLIGPPMIKRALKVVKLYEYFKKN